jgi:hypothetical protein
LDAQNGAIQLFSRPGMHALICTAIHVLLDKFALWTCSLLQVRGSQFQQPLMEFSGACEGCGETPYVKRKCWQASYIRCWVVGAVRCHDIVAVCLHFVCLIGKLS